VESITKNRQSVDVLRAMVVRAYGEAQAPIGDGWAEELGHGWFNVAYLIRLRDDRRVVVKVAPPPGVEVMTYEHGMMATEVHALELIRRQTAVPVPEVHFYDAGRDLVDADYFFMPYIGADNLGIVASGLPTAEHAAYQEALGAMNRELNQIKGSHFGRLREGDPAASWREVFTGMLEDVLRDGERRGVDLGLGYDSVRALVAAHAGSLDEVTEPVLVEWDMWSGNVMIGDGRIVAIIDHERAFFGDPLMEAGFVAIDLPAFGDPEPFLRGYGRRPATDSERTRRRLYNLYLVLIMVIETVYRGHTKPTQYDWARLRLSEAIATFGG
jgi:aminoglycoside phosphotransferase (APT) family kinase protein